MITNIKSPLNTNVKIVEYRRLDILQLLEHKKLLHFLEDNKFQNGSLKLIVFSGA